MAEQGMELCEVPDLDISIGLQETGDPGKMGNTSAMLDIIFVTIILLP